MLRETDPRLLGPDGELLECISGHEQEYGITYLRPGDKESDPEKCGSIARLVLPSSAVDQFNCVEAGRLYVDHNHPEYATAEETDFLMSAYRYLRGHVFVANLFRNHVFDVSLQDIGVPQNKLISIYANTTDGLQSYGKHTNINASRQLSLEACIDALVPHRVSKICWSGAGWAGKDSTGGYRFELSEKARFIKQVDGISTTVDRPLYNTRNEPLADPSWYRRMHNSSGEAVFTPFVLSLDPASESIICRAAEVGTKFSDLWPEEPVRAHRAISEDPTLKTTYRLIDGRRVTAAQHQQQIATRAIEAAEAHDNLTAQGRMWANNWLEIANDLEFRPDACARRLNWLVKQKAIERELGAKQGKGQSDLAVARHKAIEFHRIYPDEGLGMQLLRRGFFADSPPEPETFFDEPLPLPATRASVRHETLKQLGSLRYNVDVGWDMLQQPHQGTLTMSDPYLTGADRIERFVDRVRNSAAFRG